ncbi:apolipoprotein N-acyltransferase [Rhodococcus spelaei]|uniref:Apolipoprotein N-acyltransferase n=1 Tax=Rhodococcus spelaei TaxID=2546320 RepID=A0A541AZK3_9NOCA|nr:apolipoprotein N-acyltransferase [Rhodococcus spelaei]
MGKSRWTRRAGAFLAGAAPVFAFPEPNLGWLAWVALVPALLLLRGASSAREAALLGWLTGVGFLAATQYWLVPNLVWFFPPAIGLVALLWVGWGIVVWILLRGNVSVGRAVVAVFGVSAGWTVIEVVRSWQWLGGPWSLLGATQWRHPSMLGLAALGGGWLVGFAIVAANTGLVVLIVTRAAARSVGAVAVVLALVSGPLWYAGFPPPSTADRVHVALIQPGIVHGDLLSREEELTRAVAGRVGLVVWGESSVDDDPGDHPEVLDRLTALSRSVGADLLVNVDARAGASGAIAKTATLIDAHGIVATYAKTRLVPFGEYVPFRDRLGWLSRITAAAGENRQPGRGLVVMDANGVAIGPLVSFELTFPDLARRQARGGAGLLVYQTSTATFQGSWAPAQLASFGALRAAETGRPAVVAALTGVSAGFDARGNRLAWLPSAAHGALEVDVPLSVRDTAYDRFGDSVPAACAGLLVVIAVSGAAVRLVSGRRGGTGRGSPGGPGTRRTAVGENQ